MSREVKLDFPEAKAQVSPDNEQVEASSSLLNSD